MGSKENEFSKNYVILKSKEASLADVFLFVLPLGYKRIKKLIDCPDGAEKSYTNFKARFTIFVSILLQKLLLTLATPIAILGALPSITQPLFNFITGNIFTRVPESRISPGFRAEVKCKDWQIMDANDHMNSHDNDFRYYGALTMMASRLAYEDYSPHPHPSVLHSVVNSCWQMNLLGCHEFWNDFQNKATTHAFMFENTIKDPNVTIVAFRGTDPFKVEDWIVDLNFSWHNIQGIGRIHSGFMQALGLQKATGWPKDLPPSPHNHQFAYYFLRQKLRDIAAANPNAKFIITGHSLGGALATLFVTLLALHKESTILHKLQAVYTYGQPRVGDHNFAQFMVRTVRDYGFKYYRFVYSSDLVPRVPFDDPILKFKHFGGCVYFNFFYRGKFLKEHPNTNYLSVIWVIPKYVVAWWELTRSLFIIPIVKGRDYFEGFATILLRVVGLFIPGISAHINPNYVNLTRWGKMPQLPDHKETRMLAHYIEADN